MAATGRGEGGRGSGWGAASHGERGARPPRELVWDQANHCKGEQPLGSRYGESRRRPRRQEQLAEVCHAARDCSGVDSMRRCCTATAAHGCPMLQSTRRTATLVDDAPCQATKPGIKVSHKNRGQSWKTNENKSRRAHTVACSTPQAVHPTNTRCPPPPHHLPGMGPPAPTPVRAPPHQPSTPPTPAAPPPLSICPEWAPARPKTAGDTTPAAAHTGWPT